MTTEEYANIYLENELKIIENSDRKIILPELTIFEKAIIYKYSEDGYQDLNEKLRISNGVNIPIFGKLLSECLDKLPNFVDNIYRGVNLISKEYNRYLKAYLNDEIINEPFFISTSRSLFVGNQFGNIHFEIFCRTGKNIESIAKHPLEKEILLGNNCKFRVVIPNEMEGKVKLIEI
jgi:ADP-ribosyltransferase exoenzyme